MWYEIGAPTHSFCENESFPATADNSQKSVTSRLWIIDLTEIESRSRGKFPRIFLSKLLIAQEFSKVKLFLFAKLKITSHRHSWNWKCLRRMWSKSICARLFRFKSAVDRSKVSKPNFSLFPRRFSIYYNFIVMSVLVWKRQTFRTVYGCLRDHIYWHWSRSGRILIQHNETKI